MKKRKLGLFGRFLFVINSLLAVLLLLAYALPYFPPYSFPHLAVLSLGMPVLIAGNILFCLFWILRLRKQFLLSLIVLAIGFNHVLSLYKFNTSNSEVTEKGVKLLSYNVRQFNRHNWIDDKTIPNQIEEFIAKESPDIICFQEYVSEEIDFSEYPYVYEKLISGKFGQAILSKYPIINKSALDFPNTANNAIYADIVIEQDTIRVFNMHLQSLRIDPDLRTLNTESGKKMTRKMGSSFGVQQQQIDMLLRAKNESPYKNLIGGDMNNTAFSYAYRRLSAGFQDAFKEKGSGLGYTFVMDFIPIRIDYFLIDAQIPILEFKTYRIKLSDHEPISVRIKLDSL
ncbi:MAG TPA: endonuclease/exonuclease/phosphatase family protein [Flavobacteriaceae bacterium]|nr:endonuclease/exonuclease/phosphatase family protein [Flavobacteriaceae bacterium]